MRTKDKLVLHLWFDTEAMEAATFYTQLFPESKIIQTVKFTDTPSGEVELISFSLANVRFEAISAGPYLKINDSIRLMLFCQSEDEVSYYTDALAGKVCVNGNLTYVKDKFGVHWVITYQNKDQSPFATLDLPMICPLIDGYLAAKEMAQYYVKELSTKTKVTSQNHDGWYILKVGKNYFVLTDLTEGASQYTGALSLLYLCEDQAEIDSFYNGFSADQSSEQCGWLVDRYGLSWQIVPRMFLDFAQNLSAEVYQQVNQQILTMKRISISEIEKMI